MGRVTPTYQESPIKGQVVSIQFYQFSTLQHYHQMFKQPNIDPVVATLGRQLERDSFFTPNDQSMDEVNGLGGRCCPGLSNLHALFVKNLLKLRRNPAMLLFVFLLPAIQVVFLNVVFVFIPTFRLFSSVCQLDRTLEVLLWV